MRDNAIDLFQAYAENKISPRGGYLVTASFTKSDFPEEYAIYALTFIRSMQCDGPRLVFQASGVKLQLRLNPTTSSNGETVSLGELELQRPFAVDRSPGKEFAFLFPSGEATYPVLVDFLEKTFIAESRISPDIAKSAAEQIISRLRQIPEGNV
jgi:hypothetical protein